MASKVEICNIALAKIGSDSFITSLDDGTKSADYLKLIYEVNKKALLRSHLWRFARKRAVLAPLADAVLFDGGSYFQIPTDCLRVVGTDLDYFYGYGRWFREGDKIIADTTALNIIYTYDVQEEEKFDPLFVEAFATKLAHELAITMAQSESMKTMLNKEMKETIIRAAHAGATEQDSTTFISEVFIKAHS